MRGINEIRLKRQRGVEIEGCLCRGGDGWRERTAKVKRGGKDRRARRVRVYRVCVLKIRVLAVFSIRQTLVTD
jgi:hypothetical protein